MKTEYTQEDLRVQPSDPEYIEDICRAICEHEGITKPDLEIQVKKQLARVKEGVTYKLWQYRLPIVRVILARIYAGEFKAISNLEKNYGKISNEQTHTTDAT